MAPFSDDHSVENEATAASSRGSRHDTNGNAREGSGSDSIDSEIESHYYATCDITCDSLDDESDEDTQPTDPPARPTTSMSINPAAWRKALVPVPMDTTLDKEEDYDWALIQCDYPIKDAWKSMIFNPLARVADFPPSQETAVVICVCGGGVRKGLLQPGETIFGGINDERPAKL